MQSKWNLNIQNWIQTHKVISIVNRMRCFIIVYSFTNILISFNFVNKTKVLKYVPVLFCLQ